MNAPYGIPTLYSGTQFRSRLEARWAAFFDLCGWRWDYEPMDLPGWIPDFALHGQAGRITLAEVKPVMTLSDHDGKVEESKAHPHELLLLGLGPQHDGYNASIGWLSERCWPVEDINPGSNDPWWSPAVFGRPGGRQGMFDFCHSDGSYMCRISGLYDGDAYYPSIDRAELDLLWRQAGNATQWNPPSTRRRSGADRNPF